MYSINNCNCTCKRTNTCTCSVFYKYDLYLYSLNECGLSYVWLNQYFISEQWLKNSVKTCLQDQFYQTWHANIDTGSKTLNYRLFKNKFEFENYLNILDDRDIFTFCRFRLNNHKLPVEYGRWKTYLGNSEFVTQQILEMSSIIY